MLISLIEKRRQNLDNFVFGSVLTDLSKAFDAIPHDLLIVKLSAMMKLFHVFINNWQIAGSAST